MLGNALLVALIDRQRRAVRWNIRFERRLLLAAVGFLVFILGYSQVRYRVVTAIAARSMQARVAVVQGNVDQAVKWSPEFKAATVETYLRLSRQATAGHDVELVRLGRRQPCRSTRNAIP